ncbi:hypothetical protein O0L34_g7593 [Tuta absoluta]|nr:hypothetical protein O0L34_g7593 [Tuta absoluta]
MEQVHIVSSLVNLQKQVSLLARESDNQEMRSRRGILLLHGLPESDEETSTAIVQLADSKLGLPEFTVGEIVHCFRMGRVVQEKPRPILIEFGNLSTRNTFWSAKKLLKNSGITMSEFLTKARHNLFMSARKLLGVSKCWTRDGIIYALGADGQRRRITSNADLERIPRDINTEGGDSDHNTDTPVHATGKNPKAKDAKVSIKAPAQTVSRTRGTKAVKK